MEIQGYSDIMPIFVSLFATAILAASTEACGVVNKDLFRNTEKFTQIDEFPWMARVAFNISYEELIFETPFLCQAVLISQRHLLVVAKCIDRKDANVEPYAVLLGDWNIANNYTEKDCVANSGKCSTPLLIEIDQIIIHPFYNTLRRENNIAVLRLTQTVTYTDYIQPICLPGKDLASREFGAEELKLTGWFRTLGYKQKMSIFAYNQHDCHRKFSAFDSLNITDSHLCGIAGDVGVHFASGAALMDIKSKESPGVLSNVYLVGLMIYRFVSFYKRDEMIFIRIDQLTNWIEQNMY